MNPAHARLLRYFEYKHLPPHMQAVSVIFHDAAHTLVGMGPNEDPAEITVALRKLLEAKDCAVRAFVISRD